MDWLKIVTLVIALYGAVLSTYTLVASRRDKKRRLSVEFSYGFLTDHAVHSETMLFITVKNPGDRAVQINTPAVQLPDGRILYIQNPNSDVSFPHDLNEGRDCRIWEPLEFMREVLLRKGFTGTITLIPLVDNAVGNRYRGKKLNFKVGNSNST